MEVSDTYLTVEKKSEGIYKEKGSKFIAYIFPVENEAQIKEHIEELKKQHHSARHHCYAYRLGFHDKETFKYNDDGEPSNTAGKPILGQLLSFDVTDVLAVVVRYFGGTKLGVGGLMTSYKKATADGLANSNIVEKVVQKQISVTCEYPLLNSAMRIIKEMELDVAEQTFDMDCQIIANVRQALYSQALSRLNNLEGIVAK